VTLGKNVLALFFVNDYPSGVSYLNRITFDPEQCGGRPCIRGYRLRVSDVLGNLGAGMTEGEILADYPFLEPEDIRACFQFAAAQADHAILQAT
jgi:uncharacterized protein (DUF433 family)